GMSQLVLPHEDAHPPGAAEPGDEDARHAEHQPGGKGQHGADHDFEERPEEPRREELPEALEAFGVQHGPRLAQGGHDDVVGAERLGTVDDEQDQRNADEPGTKEPQDEPHDESGPGAKGRVSGPRAADPGPCRMPAAHSTRPPSRWGAPPGLTVLVTLAVGTPMSIVRPLARGRWS